MSLPLPPQLLAPHAGMVGPQQVVNSPYGATPATGVAQGVAALITGLAANKERKKAEAAQTLQSGMSLLQQGIPGVDHDKLAKAAKTLGLPLDFEAKPTQVTPQGPQQQHAPVLPGATMPSGGVQGGFPVDPAMRAVLAASQNRFASPGTVPLPQVTVPISAQPDARAPNVMSRIGQALGLVAPTVPQSAPALEAFRELGRRGTAARQMQELGDATNTQKLQVMLAATRDLAAGRRDTDAVVTAERLKILEAPGSVEAIQRLWDRANPNATESQKQQISGALFDHFSGGDQMRLAVMKEMGDLAAQNATNALKFNDQALAIAKEHPGMSVADAYMAVAALASGDKKAVEGGRKFLAGFRTKTTAEEGRAQLESTLKLKDDKRKDTALELDATRVRQAWSRIALEGQSVGIAARGQQIKLLELDNSIQKSLLEFDKDAMDRMYKVLYSDKSTEQEKQAATRAVVSAAERMKTREMTLPSGEKVKFNFGSLKVEDVSRFGLFGGALRPTTGEGGYDDSDLNVGARSDIESDPNYLPDISAKPTLPPGTRMYKPNPTSLPSPYGVTPQLLRGR